MEFITGLNIYLSVAILFVAWVHNPKVVSKRYKYWILVSCLVAAMWI
jgi:Na+/H+-dicarboxylate symporter